MDQLLLIRQKLLEAQTRLTQTLAFGQTAATIQRLIIFTPGLLHRQQPQV